MIPEPRRPEPRVAVVTPQQRAAIRELAHDGATNTEIARRLGISYSGAGNLVSLAVQACGCTDRTQLVVQLLRGQLKLRVEDHRGLRMRP